LQLTRFRYALFPTAAAALALFSWLAYKVMRGETQRLDTVIRDAVHSWASPPLTDAMWVTTHLGSPLFVIGASLIVAWRIARGGHGREAVLLLVLIIGADALQALLKPVFQRERPSAFFGYPDPTSYSFPSGHAVLSVCFYVALAAMISPRIGSRVKKAAIWAAAVLIIALIGFTRIYLGVHYASDVLAGYAAGAVWLAVVAAMNEIWLRGRGRR
jgi:undecaprenyl-diphosphatase